MKTKILILAMALVLTAAGLASTNGVVELPRWVLGSGASDSAAGDGTTLRATLGQPVVGVVTSGDGQRVTLGQGFWPGGRLLGGRYKIYLPLVKK